MTTAQLKAKYQLADMNHKSQGTDQTKDELAAAKDAYEAAAAKDAKAAAKDADKGTGTAPGAKTDSGEGDTQKKTT